MVSWTDRQPVDYVRLTIQPDIVDGQHGQVVDGELDRVDQFDGQLDPLSMVDLVRRRFRRLDICSLNTSSTNEVRLRTSNCAGSQLLHLPLPPASSPSPLHPNTAAAAPYPPHHSAAAAAAAAVIPPFFSNFLSAAAIAFSHHVVSVVEVSDTIE